MIHSNLPHLITPKAKGLKVVDHVDGEPEGGANPSGFSVSHFIGFSSFLCDWIYTKIALSKIPTKLA